MDIFSFFSKKSNSRQQAKSRLQFVLIQDRMNCSNQVLEMLKNDILKVIGNYMEIDDEELDIQFMQPHEGENSSDNPVLLFDIPIKNVRKARNS